MSKVKHSASLISVGLLLPVLIAGCCHRDDKLASGHEVLTQAAPDGASRAFVWLPELSGGLGATISQPYQVWMQSLRDNKEMQLVFEADKTAGVHLGWTGSNQLEICYATAQIFRFQNFFTVAKEGSPEIYDVDITLKKVPKLEECPY
jgi:hypothetical protein